MPQNKILYLTDRISLTNASIPNSVIDVLNSQGLIAPDMEKIHFCGIVPYNDGVAVFLPRNHQASTADGGSAGHYLIQALLKYYQDKESGIDALENGEEVIGGRALSLAISLINDYQANGLYVRRVKERTVNSGKVNWSRTISRSPAYPSASGPIYMDQQTSRSRYIANCEIAEIHAAVMKELFSDYGMLWLGISAYFDERLELVHKPSESIEVNLTYLKRELQLSYSDRDIFLINGLIQYLEVKKGRLSSSTLIGVRKFHNLWESMLDECLIGKYPVNSKLPVPVYQTNRGQFIPIAQKGQRTDTVLKHSDESRFAVVDAKYYEASSPYTAPGWPDLVKQFYYQQAVCQLEGEGTPVSNHFVFPGSHAKLKSAHVASRGVDVKSSSDCLPGYAAIYCHYQDPIELLKTYVSGGKLTRLTNEIFDVPDK
ncbi:LlaJI family restriction endonuclease [Photobacterium leiognathi]|uniref:LlaJI family restriction endonuclease n=1 Tax=Photobacterium leiognathi TaxID=553611 RepID=UPI000D165849|nr:LlaJI family restriction endonuclease [Photobacterium leiognathi]PSW43204.1 LlaJI family restriction endonuclease [Photobacterium leiognathi subsp. mandapamensis]